MKKETAKAISMQLRLMIPEKDLLNIQKHKNPRRSKVFKTYSDLLLSVIQSIDPQEANKTDNERITKFDSVEALEKEIE